jgi:FkbM family methyltransferase
MISELARRIHRRIVWPPDVERRFRPVFRALGPGSIAIDGGANVGLYTWAMAERGATVYAFEPNPTAFAVLKERMKNKPRVTCLQQAIADEDGTARLYLHWQHAQDPVGLSVSSSLLAEKGNVERESFIAVETIDLAAFIASLGQRIALLKLDVEGAEIRILRRLLDTGRIDQIDHLLVEMHDGRQVPTLKGAGADLRHRLRDYPHVHLDWH